MLNATRNDLWSLGSPAVVVPTRPDNAGGTRVNTVVVGAAVTASSGAAASAPRAGISDGAMAGADSPAAPTDATAGPDRLAVVERCVAAAVVPVAGLEVAGGVVAGAFVVGGAVVAGALVVGVVLVVGGHRAGRRVQRPSREVAPAVLTPDQSTTMLAKRPPVAASPTSRIQRSIVMGGATLP
ncbi:MAG: hypothetical protein QOK20_1612 [Acidimicrobiaceae bacterium]|nr:hypothetical protein [Acidimicrobiaceae bacterium]